MSQKLDIVGGNVEDETKTQIRKKEVPPKNSNPKNQHLKKEVPPKNQNPKNRNQEKEVPPKNQNPKNQNLKKGGPAQKPIRSSHEYCGSVLNGLCCADERVGLFTRPLCSGKHCSSVDHLWCAVIG